MARGNDVLAALAGNPAAVIIIAGAVGLVLVWPKLRELGAGARELGQKAAGAVNAVNPASDENLIYRGVNKVGKAASGDEHFSIGVWLYELFHGGDPEPTPPPPAVSPQAEGPALRDFDWSNWMMLNSEGIGR